MLDQYLKERLDAQEKWHFAKAGWNKRCFYATEIVTLLAGALIPIISLINWGDHLTTPKVITAALGATVTCAVAVSKLYKFQENWLMYRGVSEGLQREKAMYSHAAGEYAQQLDVGARERLFVGRAEGILDSVTTKFVTLHQPTRGANQQAIGGARG